MNTTSQRIRVLFFGEGTSLAHTVRPLELAAALDPQRYDVRFCCDPRYRGMAHERGLAYEPIHSVAPERFLARVYRASALYSPDELAAYLEEDLDKIRQLRPDVVVGDFRLSLSTAAELSGVPCVTLGNAYWSPNVSLPLPVPEHPLVRACGVWCTRQILRLTSGMFFRLQVRGINALRHARGLGPLRHAQDLFTRGTKTLYLDLPQLLGLPARLSAREEIVGPVSWEPAIALPPWWADLDATKPLVVVSSGSSGAVEATLRAIEGLSQLDVEIVLATAGRIPAARVPHGVRTCELIPGKKAARRADLVVCNGGMMVYQPLAEGVPVLGLPLNIDQHYVMDAVERAGAGLSLRAGRVTADTVRRAASQLLGAGSFQQAAKQLQRHLGAVAPARALARTLDALGGRTTIQTREHAADLSRAASTRRSSVEPARVLS